MDDFSVKPVQTLREHATALEATLSVCLADAEKRAVHKLRTETRRVEAQVALLKRVPGLPRFRPEAAKLLRQTKKVRRAAGHVRDLDVQHKVIKQQAMEVTGGGDDPQLQIQVGALLAAREERRVIAAAKLLSVLTRRQAKVVRALEALLEALEPAAEREFGVAELLTVVERGFRSTAALRVKRPDEEDLHDIRKAAKKARYQAETAPGSSSARAAAADYEELQEAGGLWHDWHDLAEVAASEFGRRHRMAEAFAARREQYLTAYRQLLAQRTQQLSSAKQKSQRSAKAEAGSLPLRASDKKSGSSPGQSHKPGVAGKAPKPTVTKQLVPKAAGPSAAKASTPGDRS